jgi:hypothetical protein
LPPPALHPTADQHLSLSTSSADPSFDSHSQSSNTAGSNSAFLLFAFFLCFSSLSFFLFPFPITLLLEAAELTTSAAPLQPSVARRPSLLFVCSSFCFLFAFIFAFLHITFLGVAFFTFVFVRFSDFLSLFLGVAAIFMTDGASITWWRFDLIQWLPMGDCHPLRDPAVRLICQWHSALVTFIIDLS